jgi:predicted phosphodiesterase
MSSILEQVARTHTPSELAWRGAEKVLPSAFRKPHHAWMRIVCISDTHLVHRDGEFPIPDGDLLIHAGDATHHGTQEEIREFNAWFAALPHANKIFVAGNHDWGFQLHPEQSRAKLAPSIIYLQDSETTIDGLRIFGSPWQPQFGLWAFNLERGSPLRERWQRIPTGVDILITHGPPYGIQDRTLSGRHVGCRDLHAEITTRIKPRLHVFGHIHEDAGRHEQDGITFVNACNVDLTYRLVHGPYVVDLP